MTGPSASTRDAYSPHLRTALVFTGAGTAGAYHAGVLRAFQEAGVKVDLVAGHGIGAVTAVFAAADGGQRLWEPGGLWRQARPVGRFYTWRPSLRRLGLAVATALALVLAPVGLLIAGLIVYPVSFLLGLAGLSHGQRLVDAYTAYSGRAFEPSFLPAVLPQVLVFVLAGLALVTSIGLAGLLARRRSRRTDRTPLWWRLIRSPLGTDVARRHVERMLWRLVGGAVGGRRPTDADFCRGYSELLLDNIGQPGFRELLLVVHDLDARFDLVFGLLAERSRRDFFRRRPAPGSERRAAESIDLAGVGREHLLDALRAALVLPVATEPYQLRFAPESYWRGETHRVADRPGAVVRLLEEVEAAGADQVVVVASSPERIDPHGLDAIRGDLRQRLGEYLAGLEAAAIRDAERRTWPFKGLFVIRPSHNPIGPLDLSGRFDPRSDRFQPLEELIDRGYEDAYRQFVDPVVAASGEGLGFGEQREATR